MSRVFRTTSSDPRRLTMLPHQQARQTPGERRRIHGPIQPMPCEDDALAAVIVANVAIIAAVLAVVLIVIPGALWIARMVEAGL